MRFLDEADKALKRISCYPYSCAEIEDGIRRCLVSRFPYGLIYGIDEGMIVIPIRYQKMRFDFDIYRYKTRKKPTSESE